MDTNDEFMGRIDSVKSALAESRTLIQTLRGMLTTHVAKIEDLERQAYSDKLAIAEMQARMGALMLEKADLEQRLKDRAEAAHGLVDTALGMNADVHAGLVEALKTAYAALADASQAHPNYGEAYLAVKQALADAGVTL